jgi:hypothetical protein
MPASRASWGRDLACNRPPIEEYEMKLSMSTNRTRWMVSILPLLVACSAKDDGPVPTIGSAESALGPGVPEKWADAFCIGSELCAVGDVNLDGRDDAIAFVRNTKTGTAANDVYVALANNAGTALVPQPLPWSDWFCQPNETCVVADVTGDGRDDLVAFVRSTQSGTGQNDVYVAESDGTRFLQAQKRADNFCKQGESCFVADLNNDKKADLIAFVKDTQPPPMENDVWVALSNGPGVDFNQPEMWEGLHCRGNETCAVGDVNGDGRADLLAFVKSSRPPPEEGDVWVRTKDPTGTSFSASTPWMDYFCVGSEQCQVADVTSDGRADLVALTRGAEADVWQAASTGTKFISSSRLSSYFCTTGEQCALGDMNGDRAADLVAFANSSDPAIDNDVWVSRTTGGSFRRVADAPMISINATLLRTNEIVVTGGSQFNCCENNPALSFGFDNTYVLSVSSLDNPDKAQVWNADTKEKSPYYRNNNKDAFCAGQAHDRNGTIVYYGGNKGLGNNRFTGINDSARYDITNKDWVPVTGTQPYWYPTLVPGKSGNGSWDTFLFLGNNFCLNNHCTSPLETPWIYKLSPTGTAWTSTNRLIRTKNPYPRAFLVPNTDGTAGGKIFVASPEDADRKNRYFNPATSEVTLAGNDVVPDNFGYDGYDGLAVLLPFKADANRRYSSVRVLMLNGPGAHVKDLGNSNGWQSTSPRMKVQPMDAGPRSRANANATLLPTGQVLVTGGVEWGAGDAGAHAEIYGNDKGTSWEDTWSIGPATTIPRQYHSISLLLPDGRVWIAGGNKNGGGAHCDGALGCAPGADTRELSVEIYEPWYYSRADRPVITSCPANFTHGTAATRTIDVGNAFGLHINKVALMAAGSVTHAFDSDQRLIWLDVVDRLPTSVTVNIPYNEHVAPPGDYMLFVLKSNPAPGGPNIPSVACWTKR